ncbi:cysteine proteinase inhibitor-like isoform X1 [Prosopis cineraria]|uniref:cysteine proteinase inhibitor-like isoform X1 n=1 Tax=Prosopis cineraria TaxID=364024 RepID=UPI00240EAE29|nr:cysteine proteinase inhibitor-like isoform X1 [Prosopis cineraria]
MMKLPSSSVSVLLLGALLILCGLSEFGYCTRGDKFIGMKLGGVHDIDGARNSVEIDNLARFAIEEHNKEEKSVGDRVLACQNSLLEFARVLEAKEQVVAGKSYLLTMEASDAGKREIYEAKVWVKPWMNYKQLKEFKHVRDVSPFTTSDLGVKLGC